MIYDSLIIGAGPSGAQAGLYIARANKKVIVCHSRSLGALLKAEKIENYYGTGKVLAKDLYETGVRQLKAVGASVVEGVVSSVKYDYENALFEVDTGDVSFRAKTLVLATGREQVRTTTYEISAKQGVSYCAICDGFFYKNKKVAVIGESEFAFAEIKHLVGVVGEIHLLLNGKTAKNKNSDIKTMIASEIKKVAQDLEGKVVVEFVDGAEEHYDGVFIAEGNLGASALAKILGLNIDKNGYIIVDENMMTNMKGVFACGDIVGGVAQIAKAVNDGVKTGLSVINYLKMN